MSKQIPFGSQEDGCRENVGQEAEGERCEEEGVDIDGQVLSEMIEVLCKVKTAMEYCVLTVEVDDHPRVLAALSESDWDDAISKWSALAKLATLAQRAKAVVAREAAVLKTSGLRVGEQVAVTSTVPNVSTGSGLGKFNFNIVTNQSSEVVMSVLEAGELKVAYDNYKAVFGVFLPVEEELTAEQLTAVKKFLEGDICPYVDFAVWVPHGNRMMR